MRKALRITQNEVEREMSRLYDAASMNLPAKPDPSDVEQAWTIRDIAEQTGLSESSAARLAMTRIRNGEWRRIKLPSKGGDRAYGYLPNTKGKGGK